MTDYITKVKEKSPLIHCITNPISITGCANVILALGARPIMAEHPEEVSEITVTADALLINLGNITDVRMKSMEISAMTAKENNIPAAFDAVGVACSTLRRKFAIKLLNNFKPAVIKGNYSEIYAIENPYYKSAGVDTENLDIDSISKSAAHLAEIYDTVILASGKTDIITDGKTLIHIKNGSPQLSKVTGTGCMLGTLCATFLSVCNSMDAAIAACASLGISGELAETNKGNGSFLCNLIDKISLLSDADIEKHLKLEEYHIEKV